MKIPFIRGVFGEQVEQGVCENFEKELARVGGLMNFLQALVPELKLPHFSPWNGEFKLGVWWFQGPLMGSFILW